MMGLGGTGVISVISHVAGRQFKEMVEAQAVGDHTRALRLHLELLPLMKTLFMTSNPIMVKKALELQGFPVGGLSTSAHRRLRRADRRTGARHAAYRCARLDLAPGRPLGRPARTERDRYPSPLRVAVAQDHRAVPPKRRRMTASAVERRLA